MAVYGLEIRDANNNVLLTVTDRITREVGRVDTGTGSGSVSVGATGSIWYAILDNVPIGAPYGNPPLVTVSGSIISWTPYTSYGSPRSVTIIYGVY